MATGQNCSNTPERSHLTGEHYSSCHTWKSTICATTFSKMKRFLPPLPVHSPPFPSLPLRRRYCSGLGVFWKVVCNLVHPGGILHKFIHLRFATLENKTFVTRPLLELCPWTRLGTSKFHLSDPWNAPFAKF